MDNQDQNTGHQGEEGISNQAKETLPTITEIAIKVITNPAGFYRGMSKTGGFFAPLIFMVVMGVVGGLLRGILSSMGLGPAGTTGMTLASVILVPIFVILSGFITAAIVFVIWKVMGSRESYETAFRCVAYAGAIVPITSLLQIVPYAGGLFSIAWTTYLMIIASTEVHKLAAQKAWLVFGALCALLAMMSLSAEFTSRKMVTEMKDFEEMTPEEAGRAVGDFMKGFQESQKK